MTQDATVVVGAGLMGAASAWALARRGRPVIVLDRFGPDHDRGSSHGSARIVRRGYADALYVGLTGRSFELWRELETASGRNLLRMLGGLDFGESRGPNGARGVADLLVDAGVAHEVLPAAEAEVRWPGMRFSGDVVFHPQAGTMDAAGAVATMLDLARSLGADVRHDTQVSEVQPHDDGVTLTLADGTSLTAARAVVAAGAWAGPLLAGVADLPLLRVTQEQVFHFPRLDPTVPPWPSVIHEGAQPIYHLAGGADGGPGDDRKIGEHDGGVDTTGDARDGQVRADSRARVVEYVRRWLPGLDPTPRGEATCLYTRTPSEDFVLDRVGGLVVCSACSGHGAKFAPLIGELVADLLDGVQSVPSRFRLASHATGRTGAVSL